MFSPVLLQFVSLVSPWLLVNVHGQTYNNYLYQPYQPTYQTYQPQQYGSSPCDDLQCPVDKCCIETYRQAVCVNLVVATGQRYCPRLKKCFSNNDCPVGLCCVQAIDTTMATTCPKNNSYTNAYTNAYTYGVTSSYGNGYDNNSPIQNSNTREGHCRPSGLAAGSLCFRPVPGSDIAGCPCATGTTCVFVPEPVPVGLCTAPPA